MAKIVNDRLVFESVEFGALSLPLARIGKAKDIDLVTYESADVTDQFEVSQAESDSINQLLGMGD